MVYIKTIFNIEGSKNDISRFSDGNRREQS